MTKRLKTVMLFLLVFFSMSYSQKKNKILYFSTLEKNITDISFSREGAVLAIPDGNDVKVFRVTDGKLIGLFVEGHTGKILALRISADSSLLVTGGLDKSLIVWDFMTATIRTRFDTLPGIITSIDISPDNRFIAAGTSSGVVEVFSLPEKKLRYKFNNHSGDITSVRFSPVSNILASAGSDKTVKIYDLGTGQMLESLNGHKSWVRDISFSPDGNELLSCGDDSRIITWNLTTTGHLLKSTELKMHLGWLLSIDRYSDGKTFACGSILGKAMLLSSFGSYKLRTGNPINKILFKPDKDPYFKLAVATRGKGAFLVDLSHATFK